MSDEQKVSNKEESILEASIDQSHREAVSGIRANQLLQIVRERIEKHPDNPLAIGMIQLLQVRA